MDPHVLQEMKWHVFLCSHLVALRSFSWTPPDFLSSPSLRGTGFWRHRAWVMGAPRSLSHWEDLYLGRLVLGSPFARSPGNRRFPILNAPFVFVCASTLNRIKILPFPWKKQCIHGLGAVWPPASRAKQRGGLSPAALTVTQTPRPVSFQLASGCKCRCV